MEGEGVSFPRDPENLQALFYLPAFVLGERGYRRCV
jgi:hypothetical protein